MNSDVFAHAALAAVETRIANLVHATWLGLELAMSSRPFHEVSAEFERRKRADEWLRERLLARGLADRPARKMPTLAAIAAYHGIPEPICVCCGWTPRGATRWADANRWLERAHMIDRCYGGLDLVTNLAPLCPPCHEDQPSFEPGDEARARRWFGLPRPGGLAS